MRQCHSCERLVPEEHRFCGFCGAPLEGAAPLDGLAQREATILFLDVTNFTAASHAMDSEQVFAWMDEAMRLLAAVVDRYEGRIDKFTGDGLMAIFGVPTAHENDPERAVWAALEMQQTLAPLRARLADERGFTFQVRIGINTGPLVAGTLGGDRHGEYTVLGDAVNLAARLEKAAAPGTTLVSAATYSRTAPLFAYEALPPLLVKGVPEPLETYRPLGPAAEPGSLRGIAGLASPMVGRDRDLARLTSLVRTALADRRGRLALISGDAGIGKSRLVSELRRAVATLPLRYCACASLSHTLHSPLYLAGELLGAVVGAPARAASSAATLEAFRAAHDLSPEQMPYLRYALGLDLEPEAAQGLAALDPGMLQRQVGAAIRQVVLAATATTPLAIFCDDLHWADGPSREVLRYLIATTADAPIVYVLVSRAQEDELVSGREGAARPLALRLAPLTVDDGQAMVAAMLNDPAPATLALARHILARAAGNPLYIEELIRMLIEQGGLALVDGVWSATAHAPDLLAGVPGGLRDLILARFDRLRPDLRALLQRLAVLGRAAPEHLLTRLDGGDRLHTRTRLDDLCARGFLGQGPEGEGAYAFQHVLVQDAIYETILRRDRLQLHTLAAEAIVVEGCWSEEERTEALARQFAASATPDLAIPYLLAAAATAERSFAGATAANHYQEAIALMAAHPRGHAMDALEARLGLARAFKAVGRTAEAAEALEEAAERLQASLVERSARRELGVRLLTELADVRLREGQLDRAADHALDGLALLEQGQPAPAAARLALQLQLASVRLREGSLGDALVIAREAVDAADASADPITLASLYRILGGVLYEQEQLDEAVTYVEQGLAIYTRLGYTPGTAGAYDNLGSLHFASGRWPAALDSLERALRLREAIGYVPGQAITLANLGLVRMAMGDHAEAATNLEASRAMGLRVGEQLVVVRATIGLAHLALVGGDVPRAAALLEGVAGELADVSDDELAQARWLQALVLAEQGDLVGGASLAEQALAIAREAGLAEQACEALRALATIRAWQGEHATAEALAAEAEAACRARGDVYQLGLSLLALGRIRAGGPGARAALEEAVTMFAGLGDAFDLAAARAALATL